MKSQPGIPERDPGKLQGVPLEVELHRGIVEPDESENFPPGVKQRMGIYEVNPYIQVNQHSYKQSDGPHQSLKCVSPRNHARNVLHAALVDGRSRSSPLLTEFGPDL